jgi:dTDP-4-dehydrorhamnose reductase
MARLLVTGASGFLGWNLCYAARKEWKVFGTIFSHSVKITNVNIIKVDLTDFDELKNIFQMIKPDAVIHTAAKSDPNYCQLNRNESKKLNVDASINIAKLCAEYSIHCVFTSTDLVFDGLNPPYREEDPVCPVNFYGEQKVLAEEGMLRCHQKVAVCRLSLMFGVSNPYSISFIQPMIKAAREGRKLRLFVDEFRTPLSVSSAIQGILIALENVNGILHLGGAERISRYDFGKLVMDIFYIRNVQLIPCKQKDIIMPAPRPPDVSLDSTKASKLGFKPWLLRKEMEKLRNLI